MAVLAGVERVGHQHRIVERGDLDAVARKHEIVEFEILADLQHRRVFQQRLQPREAVLDRNLPLDETAAGQQVVRQAVPERDVAALVRRH